MALQIQLADAFRSDVEVQFRWYIEEADEEIANRYITAVEATLTTLLKQPEFGRLRFHSDLKLRGIRSCLIIKPFQRHLLFYRLTTDLIIAERTIHGARDLPKRLKDRSS